MSSPQQPAAAPGQQAWYPQNRPKQGGHPQQGTPQQFPQQGAYQQQAGYPQAHPQQGGQWHYAQRGYPQGPGKPNDPLRVTTAVLNLAVSAFTAIVGVIFAILYSKSASEEEFVLPATIIWIFGDVLMLVAAGLLIIGAVRLLQRQRVGAPFTLAGGAVSTSAAIANYVSGYAWAASTSSNAPTIIEYVPYVPRNPFIAAMLIIGLVPLVLGLLPPLRRGLR
ncbi:hypothetical protein GCM10009854_02110 [Saccharopolyspora halophila]|uniref:Uncharacterized protein n=1 Tax=Saccharopolyspora halophila TaxID=405551 RepID=A0ABN3FIJ3_9PSEU